jgi:hypothetical protein
MQQNKLNGGMIPSSQCEPDEYERQMAIVLDELVDSTLQDFPEKYMELMNTLCRHGEHIRKDLNKAFFMRFFIINRIAERNLDYKDVINLIRRKYKNHPELKRDLTKVLQHLINSS